MIGSNHTVKLSVMDNCPTHNNAQQLVDDWLQLQVDTKSGIKRQLEVLYTSPYSPDLNLVEPINGLIKTRVSQLGFAMKGVYYSRPKIYGEGLTYILDKDKFRAYVEEIVKPYIFGTLYTPDFIEGYFDDIYLYVYKWCHAYIETKGHRGNTNKIYSLHHDDLVFPKRDGNVRNWITNEVCSRKDLLTLEQYKKKRKVNKAEIYKSMKRAIDGVK